MWPSRSCWNGTTSALQQEEITSKGLECHVCTINKKKSIRKKSGKLFNDPRINSSLSNNSVKHAKTVIFQIIHFRISTQFSSI